MSTIGIPTGRLRGYLLADIEQALGLPVVFDKPRVPLAIGDGYVVVRTLEVAQHFGEGAAVRQVAQQSNFRITIRRPWPAADVLIQDQKESDVNALYPYLQPGPLWHNEGHLPIISEVDFEESDEALEHTTEVAITFKTVTFADHYAA